MPLQKQPLNINFAQGLDTKTDPRQVQPGKFLSLQNSIFTKAGLLAKRNGFGLTTTISNAEILATFDDNLITLGSTLQAYSADIDKTFSAGTFQSCEVTTQSLVRSATSQTTVDVAVASSGIACSTWLDSDASSYYQISDSSTGQTIVASTALPSTATQSRVFILNNFFIITFLATVSAATHLQYIAIPITNPTSPRAATDIAVDVDSLTSAYDGAVAGGILYLAWRTAADLELCFLSSSFVVSTAVTVAGHIGLKISVTVDTSGVAIVVWITLWRSSASTVEAAAYNANLDSTPILALTTITSGVSGTLSELTSVATGNVLTVFYQKDGTYSFSSTVTNHVDSNTLTIAGVAGTAARLLNGVGLASKAALYNSTNYVLVSYGGALQPTYFLVDGSGHVLSKLAYSNGGGYEVNQVLPQLIVSGTTLSCGYLFKDLLAAVNRTQGVANVNGVYSQTGINLATFDLSSTVYTSEIGSGLHMGAGFLWLYDGVKPVEHGFHVFPEDVGIVGVSTAGSMIAQQYYYQVTYEWTDSQGNLHRSAASVPTGFAILTAPANFTGNRTSGSPTLASVSSFSNLQVGQPISGTGIPANTYILSMNTGASTLTMSANATSGSATATTVTPTTLASLTVNIPTLRLTYKTTNKVRLVVYRWSTAQQNYYRTSSITSPTLNDPSTDSVAFTDSHSDAQILGNDLIYTTGGVIENIAAPGSVAMTLYKSRLFLVDSENRNLLWYSKQVIEATPVEMSDLFTVYIAPTQGAQGSTGPITALSAMDDKLIIFKQDAIYYLTGTGPDNTGSNNDFSDPVFITSTVGCSNPNSIVFMPNGLMFQSDKGIWLLGRDLSTSYIGADVEAFNSQTVTSALAIPGTNQVRFTLDNGTALMYDYYFRQWGEFTNVRAVSSVLYQGLQTYLNQYGQILQETPDEYLDISRPVLMSFTTSWLNLAGLRGYERFYWFYLLGEYLTPHKLQVQLAFDYSSGITQSTIIQPNNYGGVYGGDAIYGDSEFYGGPGNIEQWKIYPTRQKCEAFQITINEIFDPSFGVAAGAGFTLSGISAIIGLKKSYAPIRASQSTG